MKKCYKCNLEKILENDFFKDASRKDGYSNVCKKCDLIRRFINAQKEENKIKKNASSKKLYQKNKEKRKIQINSWRIKNSNKVKNARNKYFKKKRDNDPSFKLRQYISIKINYFLKFNNSQKDFPTWTKLPYTPQQLRDHLEKQFESWMTWDNYGIASLEKKTWQIDHIIPCAKLPYISMDDENFRICWALENLRPLDAIENIKKGNKIENCYINS